MFQYHFLKAYAKFLWVLQAALYYVRRSVHRVEDAAFYAGEAAADDAKLAAREHYEGELIEAAQEHDYQKQHAENLRSRANSVEIQSGAAYTQRCKDIRDKLVALHEEII